MQCAGQAIGGALSQATSRALDQGLDQATNQKTNGWFQLQRGALSIAVDPHSAQLMSLKKDDVEYLWQGDPRWWPRRAPILFPIVGNLKDNRAQSAQGEISLGRHGLARNFDFKLRDQDDGLLCFTLDSSEDTRKDFPFDFHLEVSYRLDGDVLLQSFEVLNSGDVTLPYVVGAHPAFNVPVDSDCSEDFSDYQLHFAERWSCTSPRLNTKTGLLDFDAPLSVMSDSDVLPLSHRLFDVDTLVLHDVPKRQISLLGPGGRGVRVDFDDFEYLGLWSAAGDAPFVAIEPWTGCASALDEDGMFEHKRGMTMLEPGERKMHSLAIRLLG